MLDQSGPTLTITTSLKVPRTEEETGVPLSWMSDRSISASFGCLVEILSYTKPGEPFVCTGLRRHPADPPHEELIAELVEAGYLVPTGDRCFKLVHPDRLPPLPEVDAHARR